MPKLTGCNKTNIKRKAYGDKTYIKKEERSQINNLTLHVKNLEKEQTKPKVRKRKKKKIK